MTITRNDIEKVLEARKDRSAWDKGVTNYAIDLLDNIDFNKPEFDETDLLNGASNWGVYSWRGYGLISNEDIAKTLCTPSELKRNKNGKNRPNSNEEWLDVQTRALRRACRRVIRVVRQLEEKN